MTDAGFYLHMKMLRTCFQPGGGGVKRKREVSAKTCLPYYFHTCLTTAILFALLLNEDNSASLQGFHEDQMRSFCESALQIEYKGIRYYS